METPKPSSQNVTKKGYEQRHLRLISISSMIRLSKWTGGIKKQAKR